MLEMAGDIGKWVIDNKQVGGFRGWTVIVEKTPPVHSKVIASGFWMLNRINTDKVIASFYCEEGDSLKEVYRSEVIICLPNEYPLDRLILIPVEMTFEENFDWRDR